MRALLWGVERCVMPTTQEQPAGASCRRRRSSSARVMSTTQEQQLKALQKAAKMAPRTEENAGVATNAEAASLQVQVASLTKELLAEQQRTVAAEAAGRQAQEDK